MQKHHSSRVGSDAIASAHQNRRNFLFATAGVAASLPAVALAGPSRKPCDLVQLSDDEQIDALKGSLEAVLRRMNPGYAVSSKRFSDLKNGTMIVVDAKDLGEDKSTRSPPPPVEDPLIAEIHAYRAGMARFEEIGDSTDGRDEERWNETFLPHEERLENWDEAANSSAAAIEALRLALDQMEERFVDGPSIAMVRAALGFLEARS
jgi:hypothetical protein